MAAAVPRPLLLHQLRARTEQTEERLPIDPPIDEAISGGLLRGAVVELAAPRGRARLTSLALAACSSAQKEAQRFGSSALSAWIDPSCTLFAPGVEARGVDLAHLFVVTPPRERVPHIAVRVARSHAFSVVVVDATSFTTLDPLTTLVRRLSLAVEGTACSLLLLTDLAARRGLPLPVAARIELSRTTTDALDVRVAKERRGRITSGIRVPWT